MTTKLKKLAICIGNSNYELNKLPSCIKDATDMGNRLQQLGFKVVVETDIKNIGEFEAVIHQAKGMIQKPDILLFYYSGHGCEVLQNPSKLSNLYILFTSITKFNIEGATNYGKNVAYVNQIISADATVFILDCCRATVSKDCSDERKNVIDNVVEGSFFAYAQRQGGAVQASKETTTNSPFTSGILKFLQLEGKPLQAMGPMLHNYFLSVSKDKKNPICNPWIHDNLDKLVYLNPLPNQPHIVDESYLLYVNNFVETNDVSYKVEEALNVIPRDYFAITDNSYGAYEHDMLDLTVVLEDVKYIAVALTHLDIQDGNKVLDIGTGTGFVAALCAYLTGSQGWVTTIEVQDLLTKIAQHKFEAMYNVTLSKITLIVASCFELKSKVLTTDFDRILCIGAYCPYDRLDELKALASPKSIIVVATDTGVYKIQNLEDPVRIGDTPNYIAPLSTAKVNTNVLPTDVVKIHK